MMNSKQMTAVFALPGPKRFEHFVKVVADREQAWGLYQNGWAMAGASEDELVFPLWPYQEYAQACAIEQWAGYEPKVIPLDELMEVLLPQFRDEGILPGVLPNPAGKGVTPTVDELLAALEEELQQY